VRRIALSCLLLTLPGCAMHGRPDVPTETGSVAEADRSGMRSADSINMRRLLGETVDFAPLTPEPGDIWADLAFLKQRPPTAAQQPWLASQPDASPPPPAAAPRQGGTPAPGGLPAPLPAPPASPPGSTVSVQLAAASSEQGARAEWQRLQRLMPQLIGSRVPSVRPVTAQGHALWRLRTGGFATAAEAAAFCTRLQTERSRCWVVARS
jgi:hypothetical protein